MTREEWRARMMPDIRPIDANSLCRKINESIKVALEWENEAQEINDTYGVKCAIDTRRSLLSMLLRVSEEPTIDAQPLKRGHWSECWRDPERNVISVICSVCDNASLTYLPERDLAVDDVPKNIRILMPYCPKCGAKMEEGINNEE